MTRLAQLIGRMEGFGISGTIPTIDNNPGDLRHSPHSSHEDEDPNAIGEIDTPADGWSDLDRQLKLYADRGLTLRQMVEEATPASDGNNPEAYLAFLSKGLGLPADVTVSVALTVPGTLDQPDSIGE